MTDVRGQIEELLAQRILVLDGAWGVLIHRRGLSEDEYRGERFRGHHKDVQGDPDLLNLTHPEIVSEIHDAYFAAGADIATTNTFTATRIGQGDYDLGDAAAEMSLEGARLARRAADEWTGRTPEKPRFVAGSLGPLNVTLSLSPRVDDAAYRAVTFDQVRETYEEQIAALRDGGVDLLMVETIFDTLNAKAAIVAAANVAPELPLWLSFTAVDRSGRNLSGQTAEAFWISVEHADPLIVGVNCSLGATEMRPFLEGLANVASTYVSCHPNAGLPNALGLHDEEPGDTSRFLRSFAEDGLVNLVGGCCGTTPEHTREIARAVEGLPPRRVPEPSHLPRYSGLEPFVIRPDTGFVVVGERTNVTGSAKFRRLIEADDFQGAVAVGIEQVRGGANLLDVNMDADLLDAEQAMTRFLNLIATEPEAARLPIMVDSSRFSALEAGLKCLQGKGIVNSISLKEGEDVFLEQARTVRRYGAGVVVMAFDEQGQAETVERKVEILGRAYDLLIGEAGFRPEDIVLDPNVLAVATGIEEHAQFAKWYIESIPLLEARCPGALDLGRHLESLVRVSRERRRPRGDACGVPLPRDPRRARHGDRQRRPARRLRGHRGRPARAGRERALRPPAGRDRAARGSRPDRDGRSDPARSRPHLARGPGRRAPRARARPRDRRLHRGGHRGGESGGRAPPRRHRRAVDGRDVDRRRPLRLGEDVPARRSSRARAR